MKTLLESALVWHSRWPGPICQNGKGEHMFAHSLLGFVCDRCGVEVAAEDVMALCTWWDYAYAKTRMLAIQN